MRIAIFDYHVLESNPVGSCHRVLLERLCEEHDFTVFSVRFDNPRPERIRWVRVPAPDRPLVLVFVIYHIVASLCYLLDRVRRRARFDVRQVVEDYAIFGNVSYVHFCHRAFLHQQGRALRSAQPRVLLRLADHALRGLLEPVMLRRVEHIVVPSTGLADEVQAEYPETAGRVTVITNPLSLERMTRPADFDRTAARDRLGLGPADVALAFVALGHFERKGLPLLLDALREVGDPRLRLVVVGGQPDLIRAYRRRAENRGLSDAVTFAGMQSDVRPFLWAADAFSLPSGYETFSFATWEAAAAGLPLLVTEHHGTRGAIVDGESGFLVEGTLTGIVTGLRKLMSLSEGQRQEMGMRAMELARRYDVDGFVSAWSRVYREISLRNGQTVPPGGTSRSRRQ